MILADVNVLVYGFRADAVHHAVCKRWPVLRITTNPRIFRRPRPIAEAFAYCDNLRIQPHCQVVQPGDRHWSIFTRLCIETGTSSPRVTDAWFAALAIEHACTWITFDRDYARFPGLDWRAPGK